MIGENVTFALAFLAGILSFLSPCILPVLPSFLAYISGVSLENPKEKEVHKVLMVNSLLFSLGFLIVFLLVGASVGFLGKLFLQNQPIFRKVGGLLIIVLGLHIMGVFKIKALAKEFKFEVPKWVESLRGVRSLFVGMIFSVGWAPCYGPITGAILTLIATKGSVSSGFWFFGWYALGFMLPFVIASIFIAYVMEWVKKSKSWLKYVNWLAGAIIILLGILLLTNGFSALVNWGYSHYNQWAFWQYN
jgi:cytochrome c-type biogenesis protein